MNTELNNVLNQLAELQKFGRTYREDHSATKLYFEQKETLLKIIDKLIEKQPTIKYENPFSISSQVLTNTSENNNEDA